MAQRYDEITPRVRAFINRQHMFFVGTAARDGRVNVSPKGLDTLRQLSPTRVAWLNLTGSGNETAAHVLDSPRMTLMFCAYEGKPWIVRLYGTPSMVQPGDQEWAELAEPFGQLPGSRQIFVLEVDLVLTSCGFAVPLYSYDGDRDLLVDWANSKGERLDDYRRQKNSVSLDGLPTGLRQDEPHD